MKKSPSELIAQTPWEKLKKFTSARIATGRCGGSMPTHEMLKFQLEHAQARDAVHLPMKGKDVYAELKLQLESDYPSLFQVQAPLLLQSQAVNRDMYLQRPDLGRVLNSESIHQLKAHSVNAQYDLAICIVDGLSSIAIERNGLPFLECLFEQLDMNKYSLAPLTVIEQGRVAIGDHVAQTLGAKIVLVLIGERPGLLSPDSMGVYITYAPKGDTHDAQRNCISNVRKGGLSYQEAAIKAKYLITESTRLGFSGVDLKERVSAVSIQCNEGHNFLVQEN